MEKRSEKPRKAGITSLHDVGVTVQNLSSILNDYSQFIDIAKFGVGTALIAPNLKEKIILYKDYGVEVYFGGTLFEKFYYNNEIDKYFEFLRRNEITLVEISNGTINISLDERTKIVEKYGSEFKFFGEVGSKDAESIMSPSKWIKEIKQLLDAGCEYIITEGRDSGTAGLYRASGEIRTGLLQEIVDNIDVNRLIFEAPTSKAQMYFINNIGSNVNLGNINPYDVLLLEAQRQGLRSETFQCT
ncbi:phosphosulfolactate synthase [Burkholderiaceae bacterium]|nr:phosphosulfolactate synthase [Burkholderiaceae bacterium]